MSDEAKIVLWLGLAMMIGAVIRDWPVIKNTVFNPTGGSNMPVKNQRLGPNVKPTTPGYFQK